MKNIENIGMKSKKSFEIRECNMSNKSKNTGITLIALIITIVILLILLTVGIDIAIDGKLIDTATKVVDKHNNRVAVEENRIDELVNKWNNLKEKPITGGTSGDNTIDEGPEDCTHTYGEWEVTKEATCSEKGTKIRTCSLCGVSETGTIAKTDTHTYGSWKVTTQATCGATGIKTRTCTICGATETGTISPTGLHSVSNRTCTVCGISIGDYVNYKPSGTAYTTKYTVEQKYSGYTASQEVYLQDTKWRILDIKEDGTIELISEYGLKIGNTIGNSSELRLLGATGYNNGVEILNDVCNDLYGTGEYAIGGRNLNIEDIQERMDTSVWDWRDYIDDDGVQYGETLTYTDYKYYPARWKQELTGNVNGASTGGTLGQSDNGTLIPWGTAEALNTTYFQASSKITVTQTYWELYKFTTSNFKEAEDYYLLMKHKDGTILRSWLSSRGVDIRGAAYTKRDSETGEWVDVRAANFLLFMIGGASGGVYSVYSLGSGPMGSSIIVYEYDALRPVVTIESGAPLTKDLESSSGSETYWNFQNDL